MPKVKEGGRWSDWELVSDASGVALETRKNLATGLVETRVTGEVACPSDVLWRTITSPETYVEVMPRTKVSRHIDEKPRAKEVWCYQRLAGGPSADRDYTLHVRWTTTSTPHGKAYERNWSVDNGRGPAPTRDVVRVEVNDGSWSLTPLPGKRTRLVQQSYIELGGSLLKMFANGAVRDAARDLLVNLGRRFPER